MISSNEGTSRNTPLLKMNPICFSYRAIFVVIHFGQVLFSVWRIIPRDMLLYVLWQSGRFSNAEIGAQIGLTISSINRRVSIFREILDTDKKVREDYTKFRAIIKV